MNKRKLHHILVVIRPISHWYFVIVFALGASAAAIALRQNNLTAIQLRDKVFQADKENGDTEAALQELREFTYRHMNTNLASDTGIYPPIQLKYTYERLIAAEQKRVEGDNQDVYNQAQQYCEANFPQGLSGGNRLPCIKQYIDEHGAPDAKPRTIPDDLYKFDFVAPTWSPDLAGWSLVVAGFSLVLLAARLIAQVWIKHQLDI